MKRAMIGCLAGLRALAQDRFNRANGALGTAELGGSWAAVEGAFAITSNKAKATVNDTSYTVLHVAQLDYEISADITWYTGDIIALILRGTNTSSATQMRIRIVAGSISITKRISSTNTDIATYSYAWTSGTEHNIRAVVSGNTFKCYLDGALIMTATDDNVTKTQQYCGLLASKSGAAPQALFDNLLVMAT